MPRYNRNFDLTVADVEMIEQSLRARGRDLSQKRLGLCDQNPAHLEAIRLIDEELRDSEALLGRLHDQKIFYRPNASVYVGG